MNVMMSPAALQLMAALLEVGARGATREHLVQKASIGTTTFYRVMKPLMESGHVQQEGHRYHLPLSDWYNYRFKLWYDAERLYELDEKDRGEVLDILDAARHRLGSSLRALWLVGSAAHRQLQASSDLDFLAVLEDQTLYHPEAARPVNFVTLTESEFQARLEQRDGFVLSAIQYGLLLFDRDFAQRCCSSAVQVQPGQRKVHDTERSVERHRTRVLEHLEDEEIDLAAQELQKMSVGLARLMLQAFSELPAGKADLVELSGLYFGPRFCQWLERCLKSKRSTSRQILSALRQGSDYNERFFQNMSHLKEFGRLPNAGGRELVQMASRILQELLPKREVATESNVAMAMADRGSDLVMSGAGLIWLFELKSLERAVDVGVVQRLAAAGRAYSKENKAAAIRLVLIANNFRSVPVKDRPGAFPAAVVREARKLDVHLVSGIELLMAHNYLHLEEVPASQAVTVLNLQAA
jgi:hypothetical protein